MVASCGGGGGNTETAATDNSVQVASAAASTATAMNKVSASNDVMAAATATAPDYVMVSDSVPVSAASAIDVPASDVIQTASAAMPVEAAAINTAVDSNNVDSPPGNMVAQAVKTTTATATATVSVIIPRKPAGDATTPTALLGTASKMTTLAYASPSPTSTTNGFGAVRDCSRGYAPPASLTHSVPATMPASGGVFYTPAELATWQQRVVSGPFIKANDYTAGSPGDWTRIVTNAKLMASTGEPTASATSNMGTHGTLARDAAFYMLITGDSSMLAPVRSFLVTESDNPFLDFASNHCYGTSDAFFFEASWMLRYMVTYDYVRKSMASADRVKIDNFIRRNAFFMAAHSDGFLSYLFPLRLSGNYSKRDSTAAAKTDASIWMTRQYDTNGDCKVNASDDPTSYPAYAYVTATGALGPRLSVLSQWYNNRRSAAAASFGAAGVLLGETELITSAKRYVMEWLTYGVWADGSQGEYARNGDYCIASQGTIYSTSNLQGATTLARILARQGDSSLINFATTDGLFGTQSANANSAKSVELVAATTLKLLTGQSKWFFHEPWRATQNLGASGSLGNTAVKYMGMGKTIDDYHDLGLLSVAALLPKLAVAAIVMRDPNVVPMGFPGMTGNSVSTGYGNWTDVFNALPAVLLLRP
jgi:hypothetical protein